MGVTSLAARCLPGLAGATLTASFPWIPVQRYGEKNTQSRENPDWERNWENWENPIFTFLPFYLFTFSHFPSSSISLTATTTCLREYSSAVFWYWCHSSTFCGNWCRCTFLTLS